MQKHWIINKKYPQKFAQKFPEFSQITLQLLWDRNLKTQTQIDEFFNPDYEADLHNPDLIKDMDKAVERIYQAFEKDEKIMVYGDYDVDGITSSLVMVSALVEIKSALSGIEKNEAQKFIGIYIPDRESEGYGLNDEAVKKIKDDGFELVITVDCGTSNFASVELANNLNLDVIITDHHHPPEKIPNALAIINPHQNDCEYPFKELAGVGVAFKLAQALFKNLQAKKPKTYKLIPPGFEKWLLDLVALGTVADCVNLTGENRTLVKYGLLVINKTKRVGIKKLISKTGLKIRENGSVVEKK
ncbi:MAG: DHH family phosphoesterase, partial [Patescibacteria group bacterium]|nr:DHH family phosphoesterase [Patescibacteria group bacterium]